MGKLSDSPLSGTVNVALNGLDGAPSRRSIDRGANDGFWGQRRSRKQRRERAVSRRREAVASSTSVRCALFRLRDRLHDSVISAP